MIFTPSFKTVYLTFYQSRKHSFKYKLKKCNVRKILNRVNAQALLYFISESEISSNFIKKQFNLMIVNPV